MHIKTLGLLLKEGEKLSSAKRITLEDIERIVQLVEVGKTLQEKPGMTPSDERGKVSPLESIKNPRKEFAQNTGDELLTQMEEDFDERIKQLRSRMLAMFEESEAMIQTKANQYKVDTELLLDAIREQFGESASMALRVYSGAGIAYCPWDFRKRSWGRFYASRSVAEQIGNGVVKEVWVWYEKGEITRMLDSEELVKYCP